MNELNYFLKDGMVINGPKIMQNYPLILMQSGRLLSAL